MPPVAVVSHESSAFTVLTREVASNVNVVKPLQHHAEPEPAGTMCDPRFTRALDFKLRRLKEKEILQTNLRRPTRHRSRLAASNPNIMLDASSPAKQMSRSNPAIDTIENKFTPKMYKSPSPGRRSRRKVSGPGDEKPRFVTTVKTGQFLLPPPEVACLLGLETLYPERDKMVFSYASKPKAVARCRRSVCDKKTVDCGAGTERTRVRDVFGGVRALVAGVIGMRHLVDNGSVNGSQPANLMHDKRVVRGSTFAAHPHAQGDGAESLAARAARTRRRALARRAAAVRLRPNTPPPAPGRKHHPIQTEYYLEELFEKGVEMEVGVQTDLFVDRPATPLYVPAKTGADAATQIYPGDLFDFDVEVQGILEALVGRTTQQALAEVAQEEELATLREQQRRFRELRDAERAERQRLAAQDLRLHTEKERRVSEAQAAAVAARQARARCAGAALVQGYVAELLPSVLAGLRDHGYLVDRVRTGVDEEYMPWLVQEVSQEIESIITSRDVITEIVRDVVEARAELYRAAGERAEGAGSEESDTPRGEASEEEEEVLEK